MVNNKILTYVSIFSRGTGASVNPEKRIPINKKSMKSLASLPPRKDPITNPDINMSGTKKDQSLPTQLAKFCPGCKSLINKAEDGCNDYTDTSRTDKEDYVDNLKAINNKDIMMTNTKMKIRNITTVMKVLSTKLKNNNC